MRHLLLALSALALPALPCDDCPDRHVDVYDFNVTAARPAAPAELFQWYSLFHAGNAALTAIEEGAPRCIALYDAMVVESARAGDSAGFGVASTHLAPAGPIAGTDYILTGAVSGGSASYTAEAELQTACSRERVKLGTRAFAAGGALAAGRALGQSFSPLDATLEAFEKRKRAANALVARYVGDEGLRLIPAKTRAARNEDVTVTLTLNDCDGAPLAGRTLRLAESTFEGILLNGSELGAFTAPTVVTNAGGTASAVFRTGNAAGTAVLRAYIVYDNPMGCHLFAGGTALVQIEDPPAQTYVVQARYSEAITSRSESRFEFGQDGVYLLETTENGFRELRTLGAWAVVRNDETEPGAVDLTSASLAVGGGLSAKAVSNRYSYRSDPGGSAETKLNNSYAEDGPVISPASVVVFRYDPANPEGNYFEIAGAVVRRHREHFWRFDSEKGVTAYDRDSTDTVDTYYSVTLPRDDGRGSIAKTDSGFRITLAYDSAWTDALGDSTRHTLSVRLVATVRPLPDYLAPIRDPRPPQAALGPTGLSARLYDVLGRWSGALQNRGAGIYLEKPARP